MWDAAIFPIEDKKKKMKLITIVEWQNNERNHHKVWSTYSDAMLKFEIGGKMKRRWRKEEQRIKVIRPSKPMSTIGNARWGYVFDYWLECIIQQRTHIYNGISTIWKWKLNYQFITFEYQIKVIDWCNFMIFS